MQTLNRYMWHHVFSYCEPEDAVNLQKYLIENKESLLISDHHETLDGFNHRAQNLKFQGNYHFNCPALSFPRVSLSYVKAIYASILFEFFTENPALFSTLGLDKKFLVYDIIASGQLLRVKPHKETEYIKSSYGQGRTFRTILGQMPINRENSFTWKLKERWARHLAVNREFHVAHHQLLNDYLSKHEGNLDASIRSSIDPLLVPPNRDTLGRYSCSLLMHDTLLLKDFHQVFRHVKLSRRYMYLLLSRLLGDSVSIRLPLDAHRGYYLHKKGGFVSDLLPFMTLFRYDPYQDFAGAVEGELEYYCFRGHMRCARTAFKVSILLGQLSFVLIQIEAAIRGKKAAVDAAIPAILSALIQPLVVMLLVSIHYFISPVQRKVTNLIVGKRHGVVSSLYQYINMMFFPSKFKCAGSLSFLLTPMTRVEKRNLRAAVSFVKRDHTFSPFYQKIIKRLERQTQTRRGIYGDSLEQSATPLWEACLPSLPKSKVESGPVIA